ncbi:hypothetical protein A9Z06_16025 [Rhizobium sp. YK2]|nr:hypothetical protein A9Z06_16025 [Rhizobium sp. YK2]
MEQSQKRRPRAPFSYLPQPSGMREMRLAVPAMMAMSMAPSFMAMPAMMMRAIFTIMVVMPAVVVMITRLGIGGG